ncbi:MAG: hypothetical protein LBJ72_01835 [Dysgonamonadaceae bacterium]|jgi:hypothetical protein|nr:hypothetical protein [Dysgonamonadaceae bacterium]
MKKYILFFIISCLVFSTLWSQEDSLAVRQLNRFVRNIQTFNRLIPQEKVYLHFDNTGYYLGETIWFKAYAVTASDHLPDTLSRVLYVELLNPLGKVLETKKLKIEEGECKGDFFLTPFNYEYLAGFYEVRAYTKMMLNFGEEVIFSRVFPVFNEPDKEGNYAEADMKNSSEIKHFPNHRQKPKDLKNLNIDFYPEGGHLITGLNSTIAFKVTDKKGLGIAVTGKIYNSKNEILTEFSTLHAGMGAFSHTPDGKKNTVRIYYKNKEYRFNLPESLPSGYVLNANLFYKNTLLLQIEKSPDSPVLPLGLSISCRGKLSFFQILEAGTAPEVLKISQEILPAGVNQITLFDSKGEIFAERLLFIAPKKSEQVFIEAIPNKEEYNSRELISIDFSVTEKKELAFSLAVRDASTLIVTQDAGNIATYLLLSSEIRGFIENPGYYFLDEDVSRIQALDLLMMVQGWKRYEWQSMAGIKPFEIKYNREKGIMLKGVIASPQGKNTEITAMFKEDNKPSMFGTTLTDEKGIFSFNCEDFYGTQILHLDAEGIKDAYKNIRLDRWFSPRPKTYHSLETTVMDTESNYQEREKDKIPFIKKNTNSPVLTYEIKEIQIGERRGKDLIYEVGKEVDRCIDMDKGYAFRVHDYLFEKNIGYEFVPFDPNSFADPESPFSCGTFRFRGGGAMFYSMLGNKQRYDGTYYTTALRDILYVEKIVISKWKSKKTVDIKGVGFSVPFYIHPYGDYQRSNPNIRCTTFEGFSKAKDFYAGKPEREFRLPDEYEHERTLYWNPNVKTDESGKVRIQFYNNNFCRKIDICAEGITKTGLPFYNKQIN